MKLELRARHRIMDSRLRQLCDRYLFYALGRFEDRIRRVQLSIEDVSGPRGGRDSRCVLRVGLRHGGALSVESTEMRPEVAVVVGFSSLPPRITPAFASSSLYFLYSAYICSTSGLDIEPQPFSLP